MSNAQQHLFQSFCAHLGHLDFSNEFQLRQKLEQRWISPPTVLFADVLGLANLDDDEVRQLLFGPSPAHMALYCQVLAGEPNAPGDLQHPANKAQAIALTHLWMAHGRSWGCMRPFIEAGGLRQLAKLLTHPQPVIAANAMELLILATHPSMYDWAQQDASPAPGQAQQQEAAAAASHLCTQHRTSSSSSRGGGGGAEAGSSSSSGTGTHPHSTAPMHPAAGADAALWHELLELQSGPLFGVLLRLSPDVFPSSGSMAIQFLTFYLNWLRTWWCKDGRLQLSVGLLSGLSAWSTRASASEEERQLAAQLLEDFGASGPAAGAAADEAAVSCGCEPELRVVADRTLVNAKPGSEAERLKAAGNDAFMAKDWGTAIRLYSDALDLPVPRVALLDEGPRRATLHANRAAAYLERYKEVTAAASKDANSSTQALTGSGSNSINDSSSSSSVRWLETGGMLDGLQLDGSSPETWAQLLQATVLDCKSALDLVPTHTKAHFRLATALKAQGKLAAAGAAAQSAAQHASCQAERTAAARLATTIAQQQSGSTNTWPSLQAPAQCVQSTLHQPSGQVAAGPPGPMSTANQNRMGEFSSRKEDKPSAQTASDAVDQLLQQFAAVIAPTSTCSSSSSQQREPQQGRKLPAAADKQAHVLLPMAARQQQAADRQLLSDQLVIPGQARSCAGLSKQRRPLIQELPPAAS